MNYICVIVKNEYEHIREWILHNLSLGFDKIVLYDNSGCIPYDVILGDKIREGKVELRPWIEIRWSKYVRAYNDFVQHGNWEEDDWCVFINSDELILLDDNKTVSEITALYQHCAGEKLGRNTYNVNGREQGDISITSVRKFKNSSPEIKYLTRLRDIEYIPSPHYFIFKKTVVTAKLN